MRASVWSMREVWRRTGDGADARAMVEMLGLRRAAMRIAVAGVLVAYVTVGLMLPDLEVSGLRWWVSIIGSIGLAAVLWLTVSGDRDPLGIAPTVVAVGVGAVSGAAVWWSIPAGVMNWVRPGAPMILYAVAMCLLAVRGRVGWAWVGFGLTVVIAAVAVGAWGWRPGTSVPVVLRMFLSLLPVTLMMWFVRPLLRMLRVLDRREIAAVAADAAQAATAEQRRRQLTALGAEVGPLLTQIAEGRKLSEDDAARALLLEAALRDEVRGAGWMSAQVRVAAARARRRGVTVRLFDDRSVADGAVGTVGVLHAELIAILDGATCDSVTARLLPVGREVAATIGVVAEGRVTRWAGRIGADGPRWENGADGALVEDGAPPVPG